MTIAIKELKKILKKIIYPSHDMFRSKAEQFYAKLYLSFIWEHLKGRTRLQVLDAGCGPGRISVPLSKAGHRVIGVDSNEDAIIKARRYSREEGVTAEYHRADLVEYLEKCPSESFDCLLCLELLYILKDYREVYFKLKRILKRGGMFIISVKPKLYYVLYSLARGWHNEAKMVASSESAKLGKLWLNWQTADQLRGMLSDLGLKKLSLYGIGVVSGTGPDPQAKQIDPTKLNKTELETLFEIEKKLAPLYPDSGRYMLAIGEKT